MEAPYNKHARTLGVCILLNFCTHSCAPLPRGKSLRAYVPRIRTPRKQMEWLPQWLLHGLP
eukprot:scaffold35964_cov22-Tisochrysis_lutea.AAC.2